MSGVVFTLSFGTAQKFHGDCYDQCIHLTEHMQLCTQHAYASRNEIVLPGYYIAVMESV